MALRGRLEVERRKMLQMDKTIRREGREVEGRKRERQGADGRQGRKMG